MRSFVVVGLIVGLLGFALPQPSFAEWHPVSGNLRGTGGGKMAIVGVLIGGVAAAAYYLFFRKKAPGVGLAVNPKQLEFGNVAVMQSARQTFTVFNTSTEPVELLSISAKGDQ